MKQEMSLEARFAISERIVARQIEDQVIIVPLAASPVDEEDALYSLNETGQAIWKKLDGQRSLKSVIDELAEEYEADPGEIEKDVLGLVAELVKRRFLVEAAEA